MAITGLQIYKMLPKTNCAKCGYATCLAFGMAVSAGKENIEKCEQASEELKTILVTQSQTPIKKVTFGTNENEVTIGGEKVLFRHEETFFNQTCIAVSVENTLDDKELKQAFNDISELQFVRAGSLMKINAIALVYSKKDGKFSEFVEKAPKNTALILICDDVTQMEEVMEKHANKKPLVYCKNADSHKLSEWADKYSVAIITDDTDKFQKPNVVLALTGTLKEVCEKSVKIRREAIEKQKYLPPVFTFLDGESDSQILKTCYLINRYINAVIISERDKNKIFPLLTLRQNIYTDPRKPIQVEPGVYPIGNPSAESPVLITVNFSLTQFLVSGEIEASRIPAWLLVIDTDGTSLLTAWAADKFNGERITKAIKKYGLEEKTNHRKAIISAYVSSLKEEIEKQSNWEIEIGPADSQGISPYLKRNYK